MIKMCDFAFLLVRMMQQEIVETKLFFENNHIQLSNFWLESCMNWFYEENGNASYTKQELHTKIYEQWLLLDLREVDVPVLPLNINNEKKLTLNKTTSLQLMSVLDISRSKYSQFQKIKNLNALTRGFDEEREVEPAAKRALQLILTDGVQEIKALEYKPIPVLNINLTPGMKIKVLAPVTVRRGQMMLEQHNVKLLGGEVEEISVSNSAENILARYLNLPENANPSVINESLILNESVSNKNRSYVSTNLNNSKKQNPKQNLVSNYMSTTNKISNNELVTGNFDISEEEEMRIAAEVAVLFEAEKAIVENPRNKKNPAGSNVITEEDMLLQVEEDIFKNEIQNKQQEEDLRREAEIEALLDTERELLSEVNNRTSNVRTPDMFVEVDTKASNSNNQDEDIQDAINGSLELDDEIFKSLEIEKHLEQIEKIHHINRNSTVKEVLDFMQNRKYGKYKIHAKFKSVIQKVTVKEDKWTVQIYVTDDENELAVYVHSDLVADMSGFTPQEAMNLKQHVGNKNANAFQTMMNALEKLKNKLVMLDCFMEVEYTGSTESPTITKLF